MNGGVLYIFNTLCFEKDIIMLSVCVCVLYVRVYTHILNMILLDVGGKSIISTL